MPWLLNLAYLLLLVAVSPFLLVRFVRRGRFVAGLWPKLTGGLPRTAAGRRCLWLHAVSVGEVLQLEPLVERLTRQDPRLELLITTTTATGQALARERFADCRVAWFPLDASWAVRRAIRRVRPAGIVLVELELWPNFILAADAAGVPLALVNGRVGHSSHRGYRRIRPLMHRLLSTFRCLAVQNNTDGDRLVDLGAPPDRVHVTGSIKYDRIETRRDNPRTRKLAVELGIAPGERVFIAGSTQAPEEQLALDAWQQARDRHPDLRLILVPRHPERFDEAARMVESGGWELLRRSRADEFRGGSRPVVLLDTIGELAACWGLADIAFVGGSLADRGGQNMIEPAAFGAAVLFGPHTDSFRGVVEPLLAQHAACVVADGDELTRRLAELLDDPDTARSMGTAAQRFVTSQQGATDHTLELLADNRLLEVDPTPDGTSLAA